MKRRAPFLLQRYILGDLFLNVVFSLVAITSIFFIGMVIQSLYRYQDLPMTTVLTMIPLFVPYAITFTLPLTGLIASVQTYGRMAADNEILAIRTGGIHLYPIFVPALLLGTGLSTISLFLNGDVVPFCLQQRKHITRSSLDEVLVKLKTGDHTIPVQRHVLTFTRNEDGSYSNILIVGPSGDDSGSRKIVAERGEITVDSDRETLVFHLRNARIESQGPAGSAPGEDETTTARTLYRGRFEYLPMEFDLSGRQMSLRSPLKECTLDELAYRMRREDLADERAEIETEYHKRISISFASVVFALVGTPLGILFRKGGRMIAYLISFFLAIAVYYPLILFGEAVCAEGAIPPVAGMWGGNAMLGAIGVGLLVRIFRQ